MSKFEQYNIVLKNLNDEITQFEYLLDDVYFKKIDSPEVQKGNVIAKVKLQKKLSVFELYFQLEGTIKIPCDRCLDEMDQIIKHKETLRVKFGTPFSEENEIVIVPESEGSINIAWFLYEFIVLNIPIKHVHPTGGCNVTMLTKLKKYMIRQKDDTDQVLSDFDDEEDDISINESITDPRWDALSNIKDNN
jgi:uncharacterized metal-binding protein YceD (DUF177 family)